MVDYAKLDDDELIGLLFTEEDRLPREAVDEIVRRGESLFEPIAEIASEPYKWTKDIPEWWAVVHAVFILGAIGGSRSVLPLARSLRHAVAYDCDWVTVRLPSIFGRIGVNATEILKFMSKDLTSDWYTRAIAMEGLAATTINSPEIEEEVFSFIGSVFKDEHEEWDIRQTAGNILLDFMRDEFKNDLIAFGEEDKRVTEETPFYFAAFTDSDVHETFSENKKDIEIYTQDWLSFYDKDEIEKRQERWLKEEIDRVEAEREQKWRESASANEPIVRAGSKIGRNDPCLCGSGKKYKKCCMGKETLH